MAREIATLGSCCGYVVVALLSSVKPQLLSSKRIIGSAFTIYLIGAVLASMGYIAQNAFLLSAGGFLLSLARALITTYACIALISMRITPSAICIACSLFFAYALRGVFVSLPDAVGIGVFVVATFVTPYLVYDPSNSVLEAANNSPSASTLALTEPRSFLPYSHLLFISFFVFRVAWGFSLMFGVSNNVPPFTILAFVPLAIVAIQAIRSYHVAPADILYLIATLFVISGFLCVLVPQVSSTAVPNTLLAAGSECFYLLAYYTLAAIGRRNTLSALPIFAWGQFAMGAGTLVGTSLGHLTNGLLGSNAVWVPAVISIVVMAFVTFNFVALHSFSFEQTIQGVETVPQLEPTTTSTPEQSDFLEQQCKKISEAFGLTERETEVFSYLAKGRNVPFIEEELVISRNTIKTHIKHIYQKINLHSQQELIDMVETY